MPRIFVDDLDDPRIAAYRHLKATNLTRGSGAFVVEGPKLLDRLIASPAPLVSVLATDRHVDRLPATIPGDVPVYVLPFARLDELVGFRFHQGILGLGRRPAPTRWDDLVTRMGTRATVVVLPTLQNPENLGAILRLADVFGVDAVAVGPACPDPFSRRVLRVSMGFALWRPVLRCEDLAGDLDRLRDRHGFRLAAAVVDPGATPFDRDPRPDRLGLLLGSEADGLSAEWVERCDDRLTIPMRPGAESLNVAVAAGLLLYHLARGEAGADEAAVATGDPLP